MAALRSIGGDLRIEATLRRKIRVVRISSCGGFESCAAPSRGVRSIRLGDVDGLFEQTADKYGEIGTTLTAAGIVSRVTTAEGVLESVFELAGDRGAGRNRR
jgi:hypothetical protein